MLWEEEKTRGCNIWRSNDKNLSLDKVSKHWKSRQSTNKITNNIGTHQMSPRSMFVSCFRRNKDHRTLRSFPAKWGYSQPSRDERSPSQKFKHARLSKSMALKLETVQHQTSSPASSIKPPEEKTISNYPSLMPSISSPHFPWHQERDTNRPHKRPHGSWLPAG
jgi:hypothetical protein